MFLPLGLRPDKQTAHTNVADRQSVSQAQQLNISQVLWVCRGECSLMEVNDIQPQIVSRLDKCFGSCLNGVQRQFLCDECRDEIRGDAFEIEGEFTDSDIPTEQALMHATERA